MPEQELHDTAQVQTTTRFTHEQSCGCYVDDGDTLTAECGRHLNQRIETAVLRGALLSIRPVIGAVASNELSIDALDAVCDRIDRTLGALADDTAHNNQRTNHTTTKPAFMGASGRLGRVCG